MLALLLLLVPIGGVLSVTIGPIGDLHIVNAFLQPDGFNRSFVTAGGTIPGPLIVGSKVTTTSFAANNYINIYHL